MVKTIVGVFAHPDDEISMAGLLGRAVDRGINVHLICATRGEVGRVRNNIVGNISDIRTNEIKESCRISGVSSLNFLEVRDSKPETWVTESVEEKLDTLLKKINPDVIITFDKNGGNGHPDHKEISRLTQNAFNKINNENIKLYYISLFPESFIKKKLFLLPISKNLKDKLIRKFTVSNNLVSFMLKLNKKELKQKLDLVNCYKSQFPDEKGRYYKVPLSIFKRLAKYECFYCESLQHEGYNKIVDFIE